MDEKTKYQGILGKIVEAIRSMYSNSISYKALDAMNVQDKSERSNVLVLNEQGRPVESIETLPVMSEGEDNSNQGLNYLDVSFKAPAQDSLGRIPLDKMTKYGVKENDSIVYRDTSKDCLGADSISLKRDNVVKVDSSANYVTGDDPIQDSRRDSVQDFEGIFGIEVEKRSVRKK